VTLGREADTRPVWSYPLLCLAWRLGWGGRRLVGRDRSEEPRVDLRPLARGSDWPVGGPWDPSVDATDAPVVTDGNATDGIETPEPASAIIDRVTILLRRSPLATLIAVPERAAVVVTDTVGLIRPDVPAGHDVRMPPFWRPALAAWPGWPESGWVPRPRPRWDPATWTLVRVLEAAWEATGTTFLGRERPALFQVAGTRRMAARHGWSPRRTLACGRTAHRIWRYWFERRERARVDRLRSWPVDRRLAATLGDPILAYRVVRAAVRTGRETPDLGGLPASLRRLLRWLARASVADLTPPVVAARPPGLRVGVARALLATPIGVVAARNGADPATLWAAANETAARLLWPLTAPWPWTPRPVVRGPRRARQEARRRAASVRAPI
jgi:hypothetical protein